MAHSRTDSRSRSLSGHVATPDRKGREGKGREEVGHPSLVVTVGIDSLDGMSGYAARSTGRL